MQLNTAPPADCRREFESRGLKLAVLSATFNIIHPDLDERRRGFGRFTQLAKAAKSVGAQILSVSTGTCDAEDMWRGHPENGGVAAWQAMLQSMTVLANIAQEHDVTIAFEPEQANIVDTARKARKLLDVLGSKHVKVLMDAANLLTVGNLPEQEHILRNAFELLGEHIVAAHAKEFSREGKLGDAVLGSGAVNFPLYTSLLRELDTPISLIMHGFGEQDAAASLRYLRSL